MRKPETTNQSFTHNRGCIKPGALQNDSFQVVVVNLGSFRRRLVRGEYDLHLIPDLGGHECFM